MTLGDREYPSRPWVGVGVVVVRGDAVLLVRRARPPRQGLWTLPGGAQHVGEPTTTTARRELLEETGVAVGDLRLLDVVDAIVADADGRVRYHYTIVDYGACWLGGAARPGDDVDAVAWASSSQLEAYGLTPEVMRIVAAARGSVL